MTPFIQRKMILAFYRFDVTKDGLLRATDFAQLGQQIAQDLELDPDSDQYKRLVSGYNTIWETYFKVCDGDGDDVITLSEYLATADEMLARPTIRQDAQEANTPLFAALDVNGDGQVSQQEFTVFLKALGVTEEDAGLAFARLDQDG